MWRTGAIGVALVGVIGGLAVGAMLLVSGRSASDPSSPWIVVSCLACHDAMFSMVSDMPREGRQR
jgi:hypothetical protein